MCSTCTRASICGALSDQPAGAGPAQQAVAADELAPGSGNPLDGDADGALPVRSPTWQAAVKALPPRSQEALLDAITHSIYTQPPTDWSTVSNLGLMRAVPEVKHTIELAVQYVENRYDPEALIARLAEIVCHDNFTEMHAFKHHNAIVEEFTATRASRGAGCTSSPAARPRPISFEQEHGGVRGISRPAARHRRVAPALDFVANVPGHAPGTFLFWGLLSISTRLGRA